MKKMIIVLLAALVTINIWAKDVTPADKLPTYYQSLNNKSGADLWDAVHAVTLVGYSSLGYNGLWTAYKTTDVYPAGHPKEGQIWDMYSNCEFTYGTDKCGTYKNICDCYNREHSIPQSWWGGGTSNQGCDIFHLVPTDGKVNSERSNWAFGEVTGTPAFQYDNSKRGTGASITIENTVAGNFTASAPGTVFEPDDQYKGDFARGYFGTLLHWTDVDMTKDNGDEMFSGTNTKAGNWGLTKYGLALLLKWHRNDPVSQKEIDRNNGIQATQGNRNPFIDHPELAEYLWGNQTGKAWTGSTTNTPTLSSPANGSTINVGTNTGSGVSKTVTVKGVYLTKAVTVSVSGTGFSVSPATLTAAAVNAGTSVTVTYNGTAANATGRLTISSTEVSSNVTLTATYNAGGQTGGTEVVETWEGCTGYGSYTNTSIQGHVFKWNTSDVGIWSGDANHNGELSCRFGKTSDSYIEMAEDLDDGASKVTFYAANWSSSETAPTLQLQYSTNGGSTWTTAATCKPNATWQQYIFNVNVTGRVRFKIQQPAGARLNIDDIAITSNPVVPAEPSLAITSIPAITAEQDGESTVVSAKVTSENNTENITLSVEGNFLLSLDKRSWSSTLTLDPSGEVFYVRLAATSAVGDFEGLVSATTGKASAYADVNGTVTAKPHLQGDVNGDGTISITDVTSLIDYLLNDGGSAVDPSAADVDGDHTVSITDVTALIDLLLSAPSSMSMMWDAVPTAGGILVEHLSDGEVLEIYDMDAELRATVSKPGDQTVKLPAGTYVVAGDICSRKVVVK